MTTAATVPDSQIVAGATAAALAWTSHDADGEPAAAGGTVTVTVTSSDGTVVKAAGTATTGTAPTYEVALATSEVVDVDILTAVWAVDGLAVATTRHEIIGAPICRFAEFTNAEIGDGRTQAKFRDARRQVDTWFTDRCHRSFVPRLTVARVNGNGRPTIDVGWPNLRSVRWARIWSNGTTSRTLTAAELADLDVNDHGQIVRACDVWDRGHLNVEIGFVHGFDGPPHDMRRAMMRAIRSQIAASNPGVPDRAASWQSFEGQTFGLSTPGQRGATTGIPWVDEVVTRYAFEAFVA